MMGRELFIQQLQVMGHQGMPVGTTGVYFRYTIPVGSFKGREVELGFEVQESFPMIPPTGPHFNTHLLPFATGGVHPNGGIYVSVPNYGPSFSPEWQYWSRPFHGWEQTERTTRTYMAHIINLLNNV